MEIPPAGDTGLLNYCMDNTSITIQGEINAHDPNSGNRNFQEQYLLLREKEGRIYSDGEVAELPDISADHIHFREWQLRKESAARLKKYLQRRKPESVLEVGCGNGWLCHLLSSGSNYSITGVDVNETELLQARRVFGHVPDILFFSGSIDADEIKDKKFDIVIFASSVQYFGSLINIVIASFGKLKPAGEVHILDTAFYRKPELPAAGTRTEQHFSLLGFPGMASFYFHHSFDELELFEYKLLYKPGFIGKYLLGNKNPFPWIRIKNQ